MECVKSVGGEVFFGECDPTAAGYTVIDKPFVKAAPYDKDEEINIRAIMCEGDMLCLIGEDAEGNIIDSLDVNDIYDEDSKVSSQTGIIPARPCGISSKPENSR